MKSTSQRPELKPAPPMKKTSVLGLQINTGTLAEFLATILNLSSRDSGKYICFVNAHMAVEASKNASFAKIVNEADLACPDGMPIAKSIQWFHGRVQERISGPDILPMLLLEAAKNQKRVFVLGGKEQVLQAFVEKANNEYEGVVCGSYSPPFRALTSQENLEIVDRINNSQADMIFVSLGCPKQEIWMAAHRPLIKGCMLGVGFAVPVYAEHATRAPMWMQRIGLEWLHRLKANPRDLWRRYLITNTIFAYKLVLELITNSKLTVKS